MRREWNLTKDGDFQYGDEYFSRETVVKILNNLERQVKEDKETIKRLTEEKDTLEDIIIDLEQCRDTVREHGSADYWKGKEDAYMMIIDDHIDRITALELEKWYYELELMNKEETSR